MPMSFLLKISTRELIKNLLRTPGAKSKVSVGFVFVCDFGIVFLFFMSVLRLYLTSFIGSFLSSAGFWDFYLLSQNPSHPLNSICKISAHMCFVALTPGQASSPCCPTKMYSSSSFSRWKVAEMKTPWDLLLWFLAPFPPAAP